MKIENQDNIDRYVLGEMSAEERTDFERQVAQDAGLQEQLEFTQNVKTAMKSRNEKLKKMGEWDDDYEWNNRRQPAAIPTYCATGTDDYCPAPISAQEYSAKPSKSKKPLFWISSVAGIAAILVFGYFLLTPMRSSSDDSYMAPQMSIDNYRGNNSLQQIAEFINQRDYEKALAAIEVEEKSLSAREEELSDSVSLGAMSEEETEALSYEKNLLTSMKYDLNWLKANALLGVGRKKEAIVLLEELKIEEGEHRTQADSLYNVWKK
ncbi:hypothetical protein [Bacteroides sp.]